MSSTSRTRSRVKWTVPIVLAVAAAGVAGFTMSRRGLSPPTHSPVTTNLPSQPETGPRTPRVWAIAIGIDRYQSDAIPACRGAARDARAVGRWIARTAGWEPQGVLTMDELGRPDHGEASEPIDNLRPTRANLDWALREWLPARVEPDDVVVVYFAGQAIGLPPLDGGASGGIQRHYLLPIDARPADWEESGWRLDEAIDGLAATGRNPIVLLLDTSLHGRGKRVDQSPGFEPSGTPFLEQLVRWPGVTAWLAADGRPAVEAPAVDEQSAFAAALLKGLGTSQRPQNLLACLNAMTRDSALAAQEFRTLGGIAPELNLWPASLRREVASERQLLLQRGHAAAVSTIAFSADGSRMITGGQDSTVKIWRFADRMLLRVLPSHMVGVTGLALSPDGRLLASGDGAGWLRTWDMPRGQELRAEPPHDRGVDRVAFLADGAHYVSLDLDGKSWLWSTVDAGPRVLPLSAHSQALAASPIQGPFAFALAEADGKIMLHGPDGALKKTLDGPGGIVTSRRMATDGRLMAAGDERGRVVVVDMGTGKEVFRRQFEDTIDVLSLSASRVLAASVGRTVHLVPLGSKAEEAIGSLGVPQGVNHSAFSHDGRWLAACTQGGSIHLWSVDDPKAARPVALENAETSGLATTLSFSPDGRRIVSGDQDGGIRIWDLPHGVQRPSIPPRRGQVAALSVSRDGRYLLQISQDWQAQVWDLKEGRGLTTIEGSWTSGALMPDGESIVLTSEADGNLVVVDRADGLRRGTTFRRPRANGGDGASAERFGKVAVSPDGRLVAAAGVQGTLVCVWDAATGRLVHTIRGHEEPHPITAVQFSPDSPQLLTASEDGTARLWNLDGGNEAPREAAAFRTVDEATAGPVAITAAQVGPKGPRRVVTGAIDGRISLWEVGQARPIDLGTLGQKVMAVTFTPDGRWLAAAGADKSVWLWDVSRPRQRIRLTPSPQHSEQVNALIAWPNNTLIASGSDDTTVRLWSLAERSLLGTLSAEGGKADWVAYTPDGLFDSSIGGERQVTWLDDREVMPLEQFYDGAHVFRLTDSLRQGLRSKAPAPPRAAPPRLSIDAPARVVETSRTASLTISMAESNLQNLRLYQNGVPVRGDADFALKPGQKRLTAAVRLRSGVNRFYVMAGRPGSVDVEGRSEVVEIRYDGPDTQGQLHVLAMGVSDYDDPGRKLQFADDDAEKLADFLHLNGVREAGTPGLRILLKNADVTEAKVDEAFAQIRRRVRERPEDTVVVFLAGHADTFAGRFYLLLPKFPFKAVQLADGQRRRPAAAVDVDARSVLSYVAVYRNIARLGALQRLVIVDACQAEAINDDTGVRRIQELMDIGSQRARTAYLMAARRGEPADETAALAHGLMTYALLRGMGDTDLESPPALAAILDIPNADRDRDGVVTTDELQWYSARMVPKLAANFPLLVRRLGANAKREDVRPAANLDQKPHVQASMASFPLIEISKDAPKAKQVLNSRR